MTLLDSHIFYWLTIRRPELTRSTLHFIERSQQVYVSAISIVELQFKMQKSRLPSFDLVEVATKSNIALLPFTAEDAGEIRHFHSLQGHDPFDLALLAQARNNRLNFLTADRQLLALELPWVVDASL